MLLSGTHVACLMVFLYPILSGIRPPGSFDRSSEAPWLLSLILPVLVGIVLMGTAEDRLDPKSVALVGVLASSAALMRLPVSIAGGNLFFVIPIVAGFCFGSTFGFLIGSLGMAASAVITGGIGPWLPFQMIAAGWVGAGGGLVSALVSRKAPVWVYVSALALFGYCAAFFYGAMMNLYFWPVATSGSRELSFIEGGSVAVNLSRYLGFYVLTSSAWDAVGATVNAIAIAAAGKPLIRIMTRFKERFTIRLEPRQSPHPAVDQAA